MDWLAEHMAFRRQETNRRMCRDWTAALGKHRPSVIAEIKLRSPSKGPLREHDEVGDLARAYADAGADALSVLVDARHFGGRWEHLGQARSACDLPILAKGFFCSPLDLAEARSHGADAVLLIAKALETHELRNLVDVAHALGLAVLLELHDEEDLVRTAGWPVASIGVNHRNLQTLELDMDRSAHLAPRLPRGPRRVAESGLSTRADLDRMAALGYDAVLVGSSLMSEQDPGMALRTLIGEGT